MLWRARLQEVEPLLNQTARVLEHASDPVAALMLRATRGMLEFSRRRDADAAAAFRDAARLEGLLITPHMLATRVQLVNLVMLIRAGESERVERALAEIDLEVRETREMQVVVATLRLAQGAPEAAADVLAPILEDSTGLEFTWTIGALLVEASAREALGEPGAAFRALERALDLAEPDGVLLPFLLAPPELLERHSRLHASHASMVAEVQNLRSGHAPAAWSRDAAPLREPLSKTELRVLRYLPTNLHAPEIAGELSVSLNTIRTHLRNLYAKLGVNSRADAVRRARELGLLSPSSPRH